VPIGRTLILLGAVLIATGLILSWTEKLPGDIVIRGKNTVFYFPIATSLLLRALLTLGMWFFNRR